MNPYPGLRPFRQDEARLFSGREIILGSVATRARISPLTLLVARSGVGKSSFLTCRLIPELSRTSIIGYRNEWGSAKPETLIDIDLETMQNGDIRTPEKPLLVLDQFEDVFKMSTNRESLWDRLAELVNVPDPTTNILVTMREEWLGAWGESADYLPTGLHSLIRLAPLTTSELARAIRHPAEIEGTIQVDQELIDELLEDLKRPNAFGLGGSYIEPGLLQLVCHRLWDEAANSGSGRMTVELYHGLGQADRIAREFVWRHLGYAGTPDSRFGTSDRVLWVGMTRHLVVAQGIKAIADAASIAKKLRLEDLGFAGPAIVHRRLSKQDRGYLNEMPERREDPPQALVGWIAEVMDKGVEAGFLKQQRGVPISTGATQESEPRRLFEISHDALSDLFQQFCVEFESWVRGRWAKLSGALIAVLFVLPFVVITAYAQGILMALGLLLLGVVGLVAYVVILVLVMIVAQFFFRLIGYPIVRRLARGIVPMPLAARPHRSRLAESIRDGARRLGFLPR